MHLPSSATSSMLAAVLLLGFGVRAARAHGEGVLKSPHSSVAAGDSLSLLGSKFEASETYRLRLVGALRTIELRRVRADSSGAFDVRVLVPADLAPGRYRAVAVASDGDEAASLTLRVTRAGGGRTGSGAAGGGAYPGSAGESGEETRQPGAGSRSAARADEMPLERPWSGAEWAVIGLLVGGGAGLGIGLLRCARSM